MKNLFLIVFTCMALAACSSQKHDEDPNVFYTCSMDPQVMEKKPGKCPICKMELTKTTLVPQNKDLSLQLSDTQVELANIQTEAVGRDMVGAASSVRGTVVQDKTKEKMLSSRVAGRVDKLFFKNVGEKIRIGDKLYALYSEELQTAIRQYLLLKEKKGLLGTGGINYTDMLASAKDKLLVWGMSQGQIDNLSAIAGDGLIPFYSNVSGVIDEILIREGDYVSEGSSLMAIADYSTVWIEAQAYPQDIQLVSENKKAHAVIDAFPDEIIEGQFSFESPELLQGAQFVLLRMVIPNKAGKIQPGMRASIFLSGAKSKVLSVAESAVLYGAKQNVVWVRKQDGSFVPSVVETGKANNGRIEIRSGLMPGDLAVVSGAYLLNSEYLLRNGVGAIENKTGMVQASPAASAVHQH